jgi:hypothetical protein
MSDGRVNNGGKRPNSGRKPKVVEDAGRALLFELYDAEQERAVIRNMIAIASTENRQAVSAATWLDERKHGKLTDKVELTGKDGAPIGIQAIDYRSGLAALAPGSMDDSDSPSEG